MTSATAIARCRSLWPDVTEAAASTAFLEAWYSSAKRQAGEAWFGDDQEDAVAHLLAHIAIKLDPSKVFGRNTAAVGPVSSIRTSKLSVTFGAGASAHVKGSADAVLATTEPGLAYITLRDLQPGMSPLMVFPLGI